MSITRFVVNCALVHALLLGLGAAPAGAGPGQPARFAATPSADGTVLSLGGAAFHVTPDAVTGTRVIAVPNTPTLLMLWDETGADGIGRPFYAISLDGRQVATVRPTSYVLRLRHGPFDPLAVVPALEPGLEASAGSELYLVQFVTQPLDPYREQLEALGATLYGFLPDHAYIVRMSPAARAAAAALPYVRWIGPYAPAYKLEEYLRENRAQAAELFPFQRYNIQVFEEGLAGRTALAARIRALGGVVHLMFAGKYLLAASLTPEQLFELVRWDEIEFVDRWSPMEPDMNQIRVISGAAWLETEVGFDGAGVRGEVLDVGFNLAHMDFASRPLIQHTSVFPDSHGASTSGICFGDGTADTLARGLLPAGQGIVADWYSVGTGAGRYLHTTQLLQAPYFAVFQTASVGSAQTTQYTTDSADMDTLLFDLDILHCQSQSNTGSQLSRPQAWAKNIVAVGGIRHFDTLDKGDDMWNWGYGVGSIGPAADGRIKPDLCFYNDYIKTVSGPGTMSYTDTFGGTSGATPTVAGHAGLFFQMWSQGVFGNDFDPDGSVFENRPHMTTAKAFLINTAWQYPFSGTTHDLTRVHQGWGHPDIQRMYEMRKKVFFVNETKVLKNLESVTYILHVSPGEPELRVTMTYADPAGVPQSMQHRVNDLTLKVAAPDGTVYWGNNGLLAGNYSVPGGAPDHKDTVENVFVLAPAQGSWFVEVRADEIVKDGHVETPEYDADFALVVTGVVPCSPTGTVAMDRGLYTCSAAVQLNVVDCDLNLSDTAIDTVSVQVQSTSEPAGETVVLTESALASADFFGWIPLTTSDAPGALLVADGDTITVTYIDADDGQGGHDVVVTDTAGVDCLPPGISAVTVADLLPYSAKVGFTSTEPVRATINYGLSCAALDQTAATTAWSAAPVLALTGLLDGTKYYFKVTAEDQAGNVTVDDSGGQCYKFTTPDVTDPMAIYAFPLDSDPGWATQGQWAFGQPQGKGGVSHGYPDPTSGYSGPNVYGVNLAGDYSTAVGGPYALTLGPLDLSKASQVSLKFRRWLNTDYQPFVSATIRVSQNGSTWDEVWNNGESEIAQKSWSLEQYNLAKYADGQPTFYVRWDYGMSSGAYAYSGWNIDDVEIWGILPVEVLAGDLNCDDQVDAFDIDPFVLALTDPAAYELAWPDCDMAAGDVNGDGAVDAFDIDPFVELLTGG